MSDVFSQENLDSVFRSYDLRGIADEQITEEFAYRLGNVFARHNNLKKCVVGRDERQTGPKYMAKVIQGLQDAGCDVVDAGVVSTPQMKWIVKTFNYPAGIMVTASHNPPAYNGFKLYREAGMMIGKPTGSYDLKPLMQQEVVAVQEKGTVEEHNYLNEFVDFLLEYLSESDVHIFLDPSGGPAGRESRLLVEKGNFNIKLFNDAPDPEFKVRPPDPLSSFAQAPAVKYCKENNCIGVLFDADADRVLFIDEEGNALQPDFFSAWMVSELASEGYNVAATVDATRAIKDAAEKKGANFWLCEVGTVYCQVQLLQKGANLAIERSGHYHFSELGNSEMPIWVVLFVMKHLKGRRLADIMHELQQGYYKTPPLNYEVSDPHAVVAAVKEKFGSRGELLEIDGVRVDADNWWINVRASNTEPVIRVSIESTDQQVFKDILAEFEEFVAQFGQKAPEAH